MRCLNIWPESFYLLAMKAAAKTSPNPPINLHQVEVRPLVGEEEKLKSRALFDAHHYLKDVRAVGERIRYGVFDAAGQWLGVLVFCAASRRLRARDQWIGWSDEQRHRRLPLVVNSCRFLLLPEIRSIIWHFKAMPDYRARIGIYPLWSLLAIVFLAHLCGAPRGQKDLEKFAAGLSDGQRGALGIESGLHQRLDVSRLDDLSRARKPSSMLFMGMFRRLSNSLCIHWISKQKNPHHKTTADFFNAMNANHQRNAIRSLSASLPSFSSLS